MNTTRTLALVSALLLTAVIGSAREAAADSAAQALAATGTVRVQAVGQYVEVGTYQIQVSTKLGRPSARLADGTWLYRNFAINGSNAAGTLVVRFEDGRVTQLSVVTPHVELAMLNAETKGRVQVAAK